MWIIATVIHMVAYIKGIVPIEDFVPWGEMATLSGIHHGRSSAIPFPCSVCSESLTEYDKKG